MSVLPLLWAVHITDGVLDWPWLAAGFGLAAVLALLAAWRVREEDVPRIALLTAAFFVASSIHVKLGPTSDHLLLNGLVGVVLGWRAPLAILIGVTLQALLIPHGGLSTIGVNTCTEALPALLAGALFPLLNAAVHGNRAWPRSLLAAASAVLWGGCLVFAVVLLLTNPLRHVVQWKSDAGLLIALDNLAPARDALFHPVTVGGLAAFALACVVLERRLRTAPEFPLGAFLGVASVLATTALTGAVLLAGDADRWSTFVSAVFILHLPIALIEGAILGCTVSFLARVKPEMLGSRIRNEEASEAGQGRAFADSRVALPGQQPTGVTTLLVLGALLLSAKPALAHRLLADHKVDRAKQQVKVESWYETDDPPTDARAKVVRADGSILAEGPLDKKGAFVFEYKNAEPLTVQINAPGGHRAVCLIRAEELEASRPVDPTKSAASAIRPPGTDEERETDVPRHRDARSATANRLRDLALGVGVILALSSFVMSWLNNRRLQRLAARMEQESRDLV